MATTTFISEFVRQERIEGAGRRVLESLNIRSPEELYSVLQTFPSLGGAGLLDLPATSNAVLRSGGAALAVFAQQASRTLDLRTRIRFGARAPREARWQPDAEVPIPPERAPAATRMDENRLGTLDLRACLPWPVRNQNPRGTCVAFAMTALREALDCEREGRITDLAEQFLYWVIKNHTSDPWPHDDGTLIEYAVDALANFGICSETLAPYQHVSIPGNPGQAPPSSGAIHDAKARAHRAATFHATNLPNGNAKLVLDEMRAHRRPVAVSVPVFVDPVTRADNWTTPVGAVYGHVIDPVSRSVADGGHAVCLTGFVADPEEPTGGYFILRNSWDTAWGRSLPHPSYFGPEPGYGQISATYIDRYLWEYCQL